MVERTGWQEAAQSVDLSPRKDILACCTASKRLNSLAAPFLWRRAVIDLHKYRHRIDGVPTLGVDIASASSAIAMAAASGVSSTLHVKVLIVRCDATWLEDQLAARTKSVLAAIAHTFSGLQELHVECPALSSDVVWQLVDAVATECPALRTLSVKSSQ